MQTSPAVMRALALGLILLAPAPTLAGQASTAGTPEADAIGRTETGSASGDATGVEAGVEIGDETGVETTDESGVETGFETDTNSLYVFRGLVYSDGPVTQSTAWVSVKGLYLYGWSNVSLPVTRGARRLDEVDLGASYALERGDLTVEPAVNVYMYRLSESDAAEGADAHTAELSVRLSYSIGRATLFTTQIVDAASYRGAYFGEFGSSYERALAPSTTLGLSARLGWASGRFNREYFGVGQPGPALAGVGVSLTRRLGRYLYVKPHAEFTTVPDAALRQHLDHPTVSSVGLAIGIVR